MSIGATCDGEDSNEYVSQDDVKEHDSASLPSKSFSNVNKSLWNFISLWNVYNILKYLFMKRKYKAMLLPTTEKIIKTKN